MGLQLKWKWTILDGFHCSLYMHGLRYKYLIADGDSSVYQKILESRPYSNTLVEKIECRNHLLRNYCERLRDIAGKRYSTAGKLVPVELRSLLKSNILTLRIAIDKAAKHHRESEVAMELTIKNLKHDISNSPYHVFGLSLRKNCWIALSENGLSRLYVGRVRGPAVDRNTYIQNCLSKLVNCMREHHSNDNIMFWPDLASAHYARATCEWLKAQNMPFVPKQNNPLERSPNKTNRDIFVKKSL
ncbi:unnamed protein product [Psylliodes chrysocephalus]|uniref:Mutator-like transposase domain-containing protein n=1 Tax=Psylliodes chrysocephalus TaxID=3402493 RepID=A0A9P0D219_9CUCU|nr:unnamed protein product [Psylliodes chrysocephala]